MRREVLLLSALLAACAQHADDTPPTERVVLAPVTLTVEGDAKLRSAKPTPLLVPGEQWSSRQLTFVVPDGSWVKQGDVIARFVAAQSKLELSAALLDLKHTQILRATKDAELGDAQGQLDVDLAQVAGLLGIARRYAGAEQAGLARNTVLDAVQDQGFLTNKQDTLNWRRGQSAMRGKAELALNDAQRATNENLIKQKRADLAALELTAPHDGLVVLEANWSGEKPRVGQTLWAGFTLATLPDPDKMEVEIALPQTESIGIKEGLAVELAPLGAPEQKVTTKLSWVAAAAAARGRDSPIKYLSMKALVPAESVARYHWSPGQQFRARVVLFAADKVLAVPNIALTQGADSATLAVRHGGTTELRTVHLGARGAARSQVLDGLQAGDEVVLAPPKPAATDAKFATKNPDKTGVASSAKKALVKETAP